jgi:hypothetical protein
MYITNFFSFRFLFIRRVIVFLKYFCFCFNLKLFFYTVLVGQCLSNWLAHISLGFYTYYQHNYSFDIKKIHGPLFGLL